MVTDHAALKRIEPDVKGITDASQFYRFVIESLMVRKVGKSQRCTSQNCKQLSYI